MFQLPVDSGSAGHAQQLGADAHLQRLKTALPGKRHRQFDMQYIVQQRAVMNGLQCGQVVFQRRVFKGGQYTGHQGAQNFGVGLLRDFAFIPAP